MHPTKPGSSKTRAVPLRGLLLVLVSSCGLMLAGPGPAGATKYAGAFLEAGNGGGIGARAAGMGNTFVSIANDGSAGYWNPAGMVLIRRREVVAMHAERFGSLVNYDTFGYVQLVNGKKEHRSAFGFSVIRSGVDDIPFTREVQIEGQAPTYEVDRFESWSEWAFLFSYARIFRDDLSIGGSVKGIRKSIADESALGLGLDLGAIYRPWKSLSLGLTAQDLTSTILIWNGETETISPTFKLGASYPFVFEAIRGTLVVAADVDSRFEGRKFAAQRWAGSASGDFHYGAEYWFREVLALRAGNDEGNFTAGAGFRIPLGARAVGFDYAFLAHNDLDDSHRVSGLFKF